MQTGFIRALGAITQVANTYIQIAAGPTTARPSSANAAMIRFNTDVSRFEGFNGTAWSNVGAGDGTVSNVTASSTAGQQGIIVANGTTAPVVGLNITGLANAGAIALSTTYLPMFDGTNNLKTSAYALGQSVLSLMQSGNGTTFQSNTFNVNVDNVTTGIIGNNVVVVGGAQAGTVLLSKGVGAEAGWSALPLNNSASVSGTLSIVNGGTGATTANAALTNLNGLSLYGGSMLGVLTLAADPVSALQAATKSYVDNSVATAISTDAYTAGPGLTLASKQFSANTTGVTTGLVSNNIAVRSTATAGQTLLSTGTAGAEASWGALNLASTAAVTGALPVTNGGTGATTAAGARANLGTSGVYRVSFTSASLTAANTVGFVHSLGNQFVHVQITDNSNNVIVPDNITMTNATTATIDLTSYITTGGMTGTWTAVVVG